MSTSVEPGVAFQANDAATMEARQRAEGATTPLEPCRSFSLLEASGEASMSGDPEPDLQKAIYALNVLRQARFSRTETAARMIEHLAYVTTNTGLRTPEIEEAQQAAWAAISELASAIEQETFAPPALWKAAHRAIESWIELLK